MKSWIKWPVMTRCGKLLNRKNQSLNSCIWRKEHTKKEGGKNNNKISLQQEAEIQCITSLLVKEGYMMIYLHA